MTDMLTQDAELDQLLETNLDDIEDLPEYADYLPTGAYKLHIVEAEFTKVEVAVDKKDESKGKKEALVAKVTLEIEEVMELSKPEEATLVKPRMRFQESYFFHKDPAKTSSAIKTRYKEVAATFHPGNIKELILGLKDRHVAAIVSSTKQKGSEDRYFINMKNVKPL